jgi:hypothetical protein
MASDASDPRLFTVREAQRVLDEIRPLVGKMLRAFADIREEIEAASRAVGLDPGDPELSSHLEIRGVAPRLLKEINGMIRDIQTHGCVVNGPEAGLVDFPCLLGNEIVFLCWKYGEPRIGHWHRIPDGFAGRRELLETTGSPDEGVLLH